MQVISEKQDQDINKDRLMMKIFRKCTERKTEFTNSTLISQNNGNSFSMPLLGVSYFHITRQVLVSSCNFDYVSSLRQIDYLPFRFEQYFFRREGEGLNNQFCPQPQAKFLCVAWRLPLGKNSSRGGQ